MGVESGKNQTNHHQHDTLKHSRRGEREGTEASRGLGPLCGLMQNK